MMRKNTMFYSNTCERTHRCHARSCHWNPCLWRAFCFGRTGNECCLTGLDRFRWAR